MKTAMSIALAALLASTAASVAQTSSPAESKATSRTQSAQTSTGEAKRADDPALKQMLKIDPSTHNPPRRESNGN